MVLETPLPRRARRLHKRAAATLRLWGGEHGRNVAARVATHLQAAGDTEGVARAWLDAANQERGGGDVGRAADLLQKALGVLPADDARTPRAKLELANILAEAGAGDRAQPMLEELLDGPLALPAGEALAGLLEVRGEGLALARLLARLAPKAKTASPSQRRAYQRFKAGWLSGAGRYDEAIKEASDALEGARPGKEAVLAASQLAFAHRLAGNPQAALQAAGVAAHNARDDDDRARAKRATGLVYMWIGDVPRCRRDLEESAEILRHSGRTLRLSRVVLDLATVDLVAREWSVARTTLQDAARTASAAGDEWSAQAAEFRRIYADLLDGRIDGVRQRLEELLPRASETGLRFFLDAQAPLRCWLDIAEGRLATGFDHLAAIPRLDHWPALPDVAWLMEGIGRALDSRGNTRAADFYDLAAMYWTRCGNTDGAANMRQRAEESR